MPKPLIPIAPEVLSSKQGELVHVMGWKPGMQFIYLGTSLNGYHTLRTPKTGKLIQTNRNLAYTRRHEHKSESDRKRYE